MVQAFIEGNIDSLKSTLAIVGVMWLLVTISYSLDLVSGWNKAKQRNEDRTSYGLRRTVSKAVLYYALMFFAFMFDCIGMFFYDQPFITLIAAAFLIFIEAKSIFEKAHDKDKRRLNKHLGDLSVLLDNRDDIAKGIVELLKKSDEKADNEKDK